MPWQNLRRRCFLNCAAARSSSGRRCERLRRERRAPWGRTMPIEPHFSAAGSARTGSTVPASASIPGCRHRPPPADPPAELDLTVSTRPSAHTVGYTTVVTEPRSAQSPSAPTSPAGASEPRDQAASDQSPPAPTSPAGPGNPQDQRDRRTNSPPEPPYGVRLLWEEFKLTQDKIDRIGDFHFRVRTWAITLSTALVVAAIANKVPWYAYLATLSLIFAFNLIDRAQTNWQGALLGRARHLEKQLRDRGLEGPRIAQFLDNCRRGLMEEWRGRLVVGNGRVFYIVMYILVLTASLVAWSSAPTTPPATASATAPPATQHGSPPTPPGQAAPIAPGSTPSTPAAPPATAPPATTPPDAQRATPPAPQPTAAPLDAQSATLTAPATPPADAP